jgi:hypothetical protein
MASNAKIGLLLGLVVIFVIVFVINGLSGFNGARDGDDLSPIVVIDPTGIKPDIRPEAFTPERVPERRPKENPLPEDKDHFRGQPPGSISPDETDNYTDPVRQAWPKVHIVNKGDNLADIAKKFYGLKEIVATYFPKYAGYEDKLHDMLGLSEKQLEVAIPKEVKKKKETRTEKRLRTDQGFINVPLDDLNKYGAIDADLTLQLGLLQLKKFREEDISIAKKRAQLATNEHFKAVARPGTLDPAPLMTLMRSRVIPLTKILADMELRGIKVDRN